MEFLDLWLEDYLILVLSSCCVMRASLKYMPGLIDSYTLMLLLFWFYLMWRIKILALVEWVLMIVGGGELSFLERCGITESLNINDSSTWMSNSELDIVLLAPDKARVPSCLRFFDVLWWMIVYELFISSCDKVRFGSSIYLCFQ
jgi:hypothetical protein